MGEEKAHNVDTVSKSNRYIVEINSKR